MTVFSSFFLIYKCNGDWTDKETAVDYRPEGDDIKYIIPNLLNSRFRGLNQQLEEVVNEGPVSSNGSW